jgi:glycolate oxidase
MTNSMVVKKFEKIVGKDNVLSEREDCYPYSFDVVEQGQDVRVPDIVVLPENKLQVQEIVRFAAQQNIPIVARGAGTNQVGSCIPSRNGIVMHFSKMKSIIEIDENNLNCTVQPGVIVGDLQKEVESRGLFFPPDPSSLAVSTIGGAIAQSASGSRHFKYGGTRDYVIDLEVVTADGEIIHTSSKTQKNVAGYNLTQLFVGSEGTLGIITEATLKLIPKPDVRRILLAFFDDLKDSARAVEAIIRHRLRPCVIDLLDEKTIETIEDFSHSGIFRSAEACLIIEVDGTEIDVADQIQKINNVCGDYNVSEIKIAQNQEESDKIWFARRQAFSAVTRLNFDVVAEDLVVPPSKLVEMVRKIQEISRKYDINIAIMGHSGDGNLHPHFSLDLRDEEQKHRYQLAELEMLDYAATLGGTITGEHGVGVVKKPHMTLVNDESNLKFMRMIKQVFDPKNIFNPEKIL